MNRLINSHNANQLLKYMCITSKRKMLTSLINCSGFCLERIKRFFRKKASVCLASSRNFCKLNSIPEIKQWNYKRWQWYMQMLIVTTDRISLCCFYFGPGIRQSSWYRPRPKGHGSITFNFISRLSDIWWKKVWAGNN